MPRQKTTREEIIRKSIQVFREKGYYRTNMQDLAQATGLTKGAFYHHFSNKEDVMRQALRASVSLFEQRVFRIAYAEGLSRTEKFAQMSEKAYRAFTTGEGGCIFANTILETVHVEASFVDELVEFFRHWERALEEIFRGRYGPEEVQDAVQQTIADIEGSIILMQLYRDPTYLERALARAGKKL
ncbi:MAG: TetR/AcrR family transcriptional regulator [Bacteroidota bacterium]